MPAIFANILHQERLLRPKNLTVGQGNRDEAVTIFRTAGITPTTVEPGNCRVTFENADARL